MKRLCMPGLIILIVLITTFVLLFLIVVMNKKLLSKEQISCNFDTYLSGNSDFEKNAAIVMPTKEDLQNSTIMSFFHYDNGRNSESDSSAVKMIRLVVQYSEKEYADAKQRVEQFSSQYESPSMSRKFYLDGVLYDGFMFYSGGYFALAYHACEETKTIDYIAFDCWYLQFMDVESAFRCLPEFECNNQIVSFSVESITG